MPEGTDMPESEANIALLEQSPELPVPGRTVLSREEALQRAKQFIRGNSSAENLLETELNRLANPVKPESFQHVPTQKEIDQFEQYKKEGKIGDLIITREVEVNGKRALEYYDPKDLNNKALLVLGQKKEATNLYLVPDPVGLETTDQGQARSWLERQLRTFERNTSRLIDPTMEQSIITTINSLMNDAALGDINPTLAFKQELMNIAEGRIKYHNTYVKVAFSIKDFGGEYAGIAQSEHEAIWNLPGVRRAIEMMVEDHGIYFRMPGDAANPATPLGARVQAIRTDLTATGIALADANLAIEMAEKTLHIHGETAYYDGIVLKGGVVLTNPGGVAIPAGLLGSDGFVSEPALRFIYPDPVGAPPTPLVNLYARFMEDHWNDIDFGDPTTGDGGSLNGRGPRNLKQTMYYPVNLEKPGTGKNQGKAKFLRKYAHTWINSGVRFRTLTNAPNDDMLGLIGAPAAFGRYRLGGGDYGRQIIWALRTSAQGDGRGTFNDKGPESILENPLINPNTLTNPGSIQGMPKVLENYIKTAAAFGGLMKDEQQLAMAFLLKGLLIYVNSPQARADGFYFYHWSDKWRNDAIEFAVKNGVITPEQGQSLENILGTSRQRAAFQESGRAVGEGISGALSKLLGSLLK